MTTALTTAQISSAFKGNERWYIEFLRETSTRDLLDRLEAWQYTRLENIEHDGGRAFCELHIDDIRAELTRRRKLQARAQANDSYAPGWPSAADREAQLQRRIEDVKARWPIDVFCSQVLWCELQPSGRGRFKACCPFPDHDDKTPSFSIDTTKGLAWCFGCQRGGDIIKLAETYFRLDKFIDALKTVEDLSPVGRVA